jgi:fibronectin type 3 domain-containing protein
VTVQAPPARRNGFFVYRRPKSGAYDQPLVREPLDRRTFRDEGAPLGATWCYVVRAVASTEPLIESAPSNEACVERRDVSAPAAPAGLAVLPRQGGLELLWSPSGEEDLAGYRVYRAAEGQPPQRLAELPPAKAAYLDESARQGVVYRYTLTAYDAAGNESDPTDPVEATLP